MNAAWLVLGIPAAAAAVLALAPRYRLAARLNALASGLTFAASLSLFAQRPETGPLIIIDDFN
ncbi:MAG TPA: hydrogenase 4 subunit F, partial [Alphaproteobacteria bacterium]